MILWFNTFCVSMLFFMLAYVSGIGPISNIPALLVFLAAGFTITRILHRTHMTIAGPIAGVFLAVVLMTLFFSVKHVIVSGGDGAALAAKILLYHLVFLAGLLVGYYDPPAAPRNAGLYAGALFFLPLLFFILFARGEPPSTALSMFNRNPFAAYTLTASTLLLGFGTGRPLVSLPVYIAIVCLALLINTTLGALLAFLFAVLVYIGPRALFNRQVLAGAALLGAAGLGALIYLLSNPEVLQGVETIRRLRFVAGLFSNLFTQYSGSWLELDMATAVRFAPGDELDMSAMFRILHWINILFTTDFGWVKFIWIGGGTDWVEQNKHRFVYTLAAHNEYLRLLVEQGLIHTLLIFAGLYAALWSVRRNPVFIPLFATTLYLGSDNQFNDFVATAMNFFIFAHVFAVERRKQETMTRSHIAPPGGHPAGFPAR